MQDAYYTFPPVPQPGERETVYTVAIEQLDQYFTPQVNVPFERHMFRTMAQIRTENIDQFVTRLRERADYCDFGEAKDENIRDQVISIRLRRKLLEKLRELTLNELQNTTRSVEANDRRTGAIECPNEKGGLNSVR